MGQDIDSIYSIDDLPDDQKFRDVDEATKKNKTLLTMDEDVAGKAMLQEWEDSRQFVRREIAQWQVNRARELGYIGVSIIKVQDENRAHIPLGSAPSGMIMNNAARLKRRVGATLFSDPPIPEATPSTDSDEDRDAAEVSTRVLQDVTSEGKLDYPLKALDAFNLGGNYGSGYIHFWVDEHKGGWVPKKVFVDPQAAQLEGAIDEDGRALDVQTGMPTSTVVEKCVNKDGSLTLGQDDDAVEMTWLPGLDLECLTGKNVRPIPSGVADIWDAPAIMVGQMIPWGQLRASVPELNDITEEEREKIIMARPQHVKDIIPIGRKETSQGGGLKDETLVFVLRRYNEQCFEYPKGFYGMIVGDGHVVERGVWFDEDRGEPLDIPITQFKQYYDEGNPHGVGIMTYLGPGFESRAILHASMFEHLDRYGRRKTFVPTTSMLTAEQLQSPTQTVIPLMTGHEPKYEEIPDFPEMVEKMEARITADMEDESNLQGTAQAMDSPNVKSGLHAQRILEQVNVLMTDLIQNTERALIRGYRIMLQQIRYRFDHSQQVRYLGPDNSFKVARFTGADLGSTQDVRLHKGSFTQLAPSAKAALAQSFTEAGFFNPQELEGVISGNVGGMLGVQDNPHRLRVRRQVADWQEGPPEGWQPPEPQIDPQTQQPVPAQDPVMTGIFDVRAIDADPEVALIREFELGRAIAGGKFLSHAPEWQQGILDAYSQAFSASGKMTIAEQQQAAQAAQEAQQAAVEADAADKKANRDVDLAKTGMKLDADGAEGSAERQLTEKVEVLKANVALHNPASGEPTESVAKHT